MSREPPDPPAATGRHAVTADRGDNAVRLDLVLLRHLGAQLALSRRRLQQAIENGDVSVNGIAVTRTSARVVAGDRIDAALPAPVRRLPPQPQDLPLDVLFEDEHLLAVNKPAGVVTHPSYKHSDGTLFNALLWHVRATQVRPRLLGRLDKDTSGVVLVSKTRPAHACVVKAMRAGDVRKEYVAVVRGVPQPAFGDIALSLTRDRDDVRRVAVSESGGKQSVTRYDTLSTGQLRHETAEAQADRASAIHLALVRCELVTGRMHQIRVHLAARGWPIVGDRVYEAARHRLPVDRHRQAAAWQLSHSTDAKADMWDPASAGFIARHALHAWRVSLAHPVTGDKLVIIAPIPADMRELMQAAGLTNGERL